MIFKKIIKKEINFTEKFALLNLLKALNALTPPQDGAGRQDNAPPAQKQENAPAAPSAPAKEPEPVYYPNVMQSVLVRHEAISNRIKSKK